MNPTTNTKSVPHLRCMQAPEVLRGGKATTASDVYSFGMVGVQQHASV